MKMGGLCRTGGDTGTGSVLANWSSKKLFVKFSKTPDLVL